MSPTETDLAPDGDQAEVVARLSRPEAWDGRAVERVDTHVSALFLVGDRVYKLKRAVRLPFLDFTDPTARRQACDVEVRINRRTAPDLYLGVLPVTADGRVDGAGATVDWVVEMRRFAAPDLFDTMAEEGRLGGDLLEETALAIARFHADAPRRPDMWSRAQIDKLIDGIDDSYPVPPPTPVPGAAVAAVVRRIRELAATRAGRFEERRAGGFVREVHGDLHLRNIVLWRGRPTLFDAIEFDEALRCIDCVYDVAFLLMDLLYRGMPAAANRTFNAYFRATGDLEGLAFLPVFLGMRAAIRGHVEISSAQYAGDPGPCLEHACRYVELAERCLRPAGPAVVAIGGLSGTGKSTVARALAPELPPIPGALILRSDEIRKELAGVAPTEPLDEAFYTHAWSEKVYTALVERCGRALAAGWPVVADAVFGRTAEREAVAAAARRAGVPFTGLWLEAPADILEARVGARRGDASDATVEVLRKQLAGAMTAGDWRPVDASGTPEENAVRARRALGTGGIA